MRLMRGGGLYYTVQGIEGALFGCISRNLHNTFGWKPVVKSGMTLGNTAEPSHRSSSEPTNSTRTLITILSPVADTVQAREVELLIC